jgi:hypothetical protein
MTNEVIFYTQIATIVAFVFTVFGLYRLLVGVKDATIESLRQQLDSSRAKIEELEKKSPSVLIEMYARQLALAEKMVEKVEQERATAQAHLEKFSQLSRTLQSADVVMIQAKHVTNSLSAISTVTNDYARMLRYQWASKSLLHELSAAGFIAKHLGMKQVRAATDEELNEQVANLVRSPRLRVEEGPIDVHEGNQKNLMGLSLSVHALHETECITADDQLTDKGLKVFREAARLAEHSE